AAAPMPATASLRSRLSDKVIEASSHRKEAFDGHPEAEDGSPKEHQARPDRTERPSSGRPGTEEITGAQYAATKSDAGADLCISEGTQGAAQRCPSRSQCDRPLRSSRRCQRSRARGSLAADQGGSEEVRGGDPCQEL